MSRRDDLAARLAALRDRVASACSAAGRDPAGVSVVVVTKTFPASDVRLLVDLGVRDIGENRDQEAVAKAAACAELDITWHFVGQLQTNKAGSVAHYASVVHSVDRARLVDALDRGAVSAGRRIRCLIQVSLDEVPGAGRRGGAPPGEVHALAERVVAAGSLGLAGVMAVAPLDRDAAAAYAQLADIAAEVRTRHPTANWISAGMTGDLEVAIAHGATHLRVGTAILGTRPDAV